MENVTPEVIATAMGRPSPTSPEYEQWAMWINDTRMLLRVGNGNHAGLGDLTKLDQDVLAYVVREAVIAYLRRPDDATQVDISVDDGKVSRTYSSSTGRVTIRDEWWEMLAPTKTRGGAFSIGSGNAGPGFADLGPYPLSGYPLAGYPLAGAPVAPAPVYSPGTIWPPVVPVFDEE